MTIKGKFSPYFDEDKLAWGDIESFIEGYKRNVDLMNVTQQIAIETTKSIIQLQTQYMKQAFDQLTAQAQKGLSPNVNDDHFEGQTEYGKATVNHAIEHANKMNTILTKSNEKIIENVQKSFKEGLKESAATTKKAKTTTKKYK